MTIARQSTKNKIKIAARIDSQHWKPFVIRDPVHGYLEIAAHERVVIDHPITQRLRRVNQTGLADFVFPEARTSRFAHSLGAMHLASKFIISALENASEDHADKFFEEIKTWLKEEGVEASVLDSLLVTDKRSGGGGLLAARAQFRHPAMRLRSVELRRLLALVEAGTRLAALYHDLGHMPFSHDFEDALIAYSQTKRKIGVGLENLLSQKPHEAVGHRLAELVFQVLVAPLSDLSPELKTTVSTVFKFAKAILDEEVDYGWADEPQVGYLGWLHSVVDGEVDVDRADYLLRDARALGMEFAEYDLPRLASNVLMYLDHSLGFVTAIDEKGFSALESFYISRARSNQVLVRHHKSAQFGVALRYVTAKALGKSPDASKFLTDLERLGNPAPFSNSEASQMLQRFATYDDGWWLQVLRRTSFADDALARACFDLIVSRRPAFVSYWKRKGELSEEQRGVLRKLAELEDDDSIGDSRRELESRGVLIAIHKFAPYKILYSSDDSANKSVGVVLTSKGLRSASDLSPLLRSLKDAWDDDVKLHAFGAYGIAPDSKALILDALKPKSPSPKTRSRSKVAAPKKKIKRKK